MEIENSFKIHKGNIFPRIHPFNINIPVVPHKAVAEVSKMETYRRGELVRRKNGRANPLMD